MKKEYVKYNLGIITKNSLFEIIWHKCGRKISWYISQLIPGDEKADDLFQEVMIKLYNSIDSYNPVFSFNTWIYSIARNHCYDYIKCKKININDDADINESLYNITPEDSFLVLDTEKRIKDAFDKLSAKEKETAYLRLYEEKTFREIASITNEKTPTVKAVYQRAQKKLQYYLKDYSDEN